MRLDGEAKVEIELKEVRLYGATGRKRFGSGFCFMLGEVGDVLGSSCLGGDVGDDCGE